VKHVVRESPTRVHIELTTHCNLRCVFCAHSDSQSSEHMPRDVSRIVMRDLLPSCEEVELQGTGEALLYPGFDRVLRTAANCGCVVNLITNGLLLTRRHIDMLMESRSQLVISVDGATARTYEWHRHGASFSVLLAKLKMWQEASLSASQLVPPPSLTLHMTLTAQNIHELCSVVLMASRFQADAVFVSIVRRARNREAIWRELRLDSRREEVHGELLGAQAEARELGIAFACSSLLPSGSGVRPLCPAPWEHVYIGASGDVYPCCQFQQSMGNCRSSPFSAIWQGEAFASLREEMASGVLPEECRQCVLPWALP
jgi:radical SAM protein with 4Fe4S-binding SPASM domain